MKRFWLVLLSLGLIVAFSTSAMAVDVKFSGEFYAAGMYLDKTDVVKSVRAGYFGLEVDNPSKQSTAFYFQRLRLKTEFIVAPGLTLTTRADIMERTWGARRSDVPLVTSNMYDSAATRAENENIAFDWAYLTYVSPIGAISVGYMNDYVWGTVFGDRAKPTPKIALVAPVGPFIFGGSINKETTGLLVASLPGENSRTSINAVSTMDADCDSFVLFAIYNFKQGQVGYLFRYFRDATLKPTAGMVGTLYSSTPYFKAKFGPVALEGELSYGFGRVSYDKNPIGVNDINLDSLSAYLNGVADFGMVYVGGTFAFMNGQNPNAKDHTTQLNSGGYDWNPCLIMFNYERTNWAGSIAGMGASNNSSMINAWFFQGKAGFRPIDKLDIMASVSYANAVIKPTNAWVNNSYGTEIDLTATYKITNNLSYMLGGGYWFVGSYYRGVSSVDALTTLRNDFLVINKLTLTF